MPVDLAWIDAGVTPFGYDSPWRSRRFCDVVDDSIRAINNEDRGRLEHQAPRSTSIRAIASSMWWLQAP